MSGTAIRLAKRVANLPGVRQWRMARFDRSFEEGAAVGTCRGVFPTYELAAAAAPTTRPLGYDNDDAAGLYRDRLERVYPSDYPMMLWLQNAFADGARSVFDLGGHIGIAYYTYQRKIAFPREASWTVHDVPAVMESGRREARHLDALGRLSFSESDASAADSDLFFTAGCLQYLEQTLGERLAALPRKPRWVLVNLLPLHDSQAYWTVQSIGAAYCPYRIQHRAAFFAEMNALGYETLDAWENLEKSCWIAFEPAHSLDRYYGAAFRLR